jgi:CRP/FNR family cyclic AMP-dependent transcriptional regulator
MTALPARSGAEFLASVPLFAEVPMAQLEELADRLRWGRYARGDVIFLRGEPGEAMFLIASGTVKLGLSSPDGKEFLLDMLGPGAFFGELALLDGEPRSADAVAVEACQLYVLMRLDFLRYLEQRASVAAGLLAVLSRRLRRDALVLEGAAFLDVPARLGRAILQLSESLGEPQADGSVLIPSRLTQSELAGLVGATRETVNRWLALYERMGWIRFTRSQLAILRPDKLRERAR